MSSQIPLFRRVLSWSTFTAGMLAAITGCYATFPMWMHDIGMRGMAETGCRFDERADGWMVTELFWEEAKEAEATGCGRLVGKYVYSIDGHPLSSRDDLFPRVYGKVGDEQHWVVGDGKDKPTEEVTVKLREHPVVQTLSTGSSAQASVSGGVVFLLLEVFGALAQTINIALAGLLFFFLRKRISVAPALTGSLFAVGLGLNFDIGFTPAWYEWVSKGALLIGVLGLGTAVVALPDGKIRSPKAAMFVGLWVVLVAICNMEFLPFYDLIPDSTAAASSVVFAGGGLIALLSRQRRSTSRREQLSLRWVILGLMVPAVALIPALVPSLSPAIQEFQLSVGFPLSTMVVPLAIVHGLHPLSRFDLVRLVRFSTLGGMVVSCFAGAWATIHLTFYPIMQTLGLGDEMPHLAIVLALGAATLAFYFRYPLITLVDILFFPMRLQALRSVTESRSNLGDCWTIKEIEWCAQRALKGGFNATGAQVALLEGDSWRDLVDHSKVPLELTPEELAQLQKGEGVEIVLDGDDGFTTQILPLQSRGVFLGILIAQPSEESRYTVWDRMLLRQIADAIAEAVWRCTRVRDLNTAGVFSSREIMPKRLPVLSEG